jgi:hypothetical protein
MDSLQQNGSKTKGKADTNIHFDGKVVSSSGIKSTRQFASFCSILSQHDDDDDDDDDDIHVIVTMKGSLFPWFCSKQTTIISIECKSS